MKLLSPATRIYFLAFAFPCLLAQGKQTSFLKNALWSDPLVEQNSNGGYDISVKVSPRVDSVTVEYGYDASPLVPRESSLSRRRRRRQLVSRSREDDPASKQQRQAQKNPIPSSGIRSKRQTRAHHASTAARRRGLQEGAQDPFYVFGGTVNGTIGSSSLFTASWDFKFHVLVEAAAKKKSEIYVIDKGHGEPNTFPCIYFPNGNMTKEQVKAMLSEEDASAAGGKEGEVAFDGSHTFQLSLNGTVVSPSAGGQFVPKLYASGTVSETDVSFIFGGIDGSGIFDWGPTPAFTKFTVETVSANNFVFNRGVKTVTLDMYAENDKLSDFAYALFDISEDGSVELNEQGLEDGKQRNQSSAGTVGYGTTLLLLMMITSLLS